MVKTNLILWCCSRSLFYIQFLSEVRFPVLYRTFDLCNYFTLENLALKGKHVKIENYNIQLRVNYLHCQLYLFSEPHKIWVVIKR